MKRDNTIWQDLKYPFGRPEDLAFDERQLSALKNIITIARERLWLWKTKGTNELHRSCDENLTDSQVSTVEESIKVCERLRYKHEEIINTKE